MIQITKAECKVVREQYPAISIPRTCKQKSKRHHYFLVEDENLLRLVASTNSQAAKLVAEIDARRKLYKGRKKEYRHENGYIGG